MASTLLEPGTLLPVGCPAETIDPSKMIVTWEGFEVALNNLAVDIRDSGIQFDQIVCVARGGMAVGDMLSRLFNVPIAVICASSYREEGGTRQGELSISKSIAMTTDGLCKRILLVDDLVDSGKTLKAIKDLLQQDENVDVVTTAVLWKKSETQVEPDFFAEEIPADTWIELPAEKFEGMMLADLKRI